ncbi:hypothetical protein QBC47DRAFT_404118 [Echria macrotheca]|uniref:MHYT domain-containing protein n=1 Tax=Echria macrotheca TaxID=438768 RepID=A0AAJ0F3R4_9PEZI|nr:hypothetical protein QBC47DRAFT_404118 [Echria macrotheca]
MEPPPGTSPEDFSWLLGEVVPFHFDAAILVLSYIVSFVGAASTLELINRRTSRNGLYNYLLLLGAAISMGGVSIWCMHYIGNRATALLDGQPQLQIVFSVRVTVASFFVPILVLLVAFWVVTESNTISWWRIAVSGCLSGGAICGMHYLGNASISNYECEYNVANVAGAALIAATASSVALALFFVFRAAWTSSWWKRVGCAIVLASAVSGMHWCAALGTTYRLLHPNSADDYDMRNTTIIVVSCLSVATCMVMAGLAISSARMRKGYASKAQQITIAAAVFDKQGRILVTPDGCLPSEEITSTFMQKTQDDIFSTAHPLFQWAYQASHNWLSVSDLIDRMTRHLARLPHHGRNIRTGIDLVDHEGHIIDNYDTVFRELFCLAASALAAKLNEEVVNAGSLWDEMFSTGGSSRSSVEQTEQPHSGSADTKQEDMAEKGMAYKSQNTHGSMMVLVRRLGNDRVADRLEAAGYRFAGLHQVAPIIGSTMQIRTRNLELKLQSMVRHTQQVLLDPGVHLGLFAVQPRTDMFGYDVLVREQSHNLLPSVWIPLDRLDQAQNKFLRRFDGQTMSAVWQQLARVDAFPNDSRIAALLRDAIQDLRVSLSDVVYDEAKFSSKPVLAPCNSPTELKSLTCSLLTFSIVLPSGTPAISPKYRFIPLRLLKTQQLVYDNSHHAAFARSVHREILPVLNASAPPTVAHKAPIQSSHRKNFVPLPDSPWSTLGRFSRPMASATRHRSDSDNLVTTSQEPMTPSSESLSSIQLYAINKEAGLTPEDDLKTQFEETTRTVHPYGPGKQQESSFGGIMISSEVTVDVEDASRHIPSPIEPPQPSRSRSDSTMGLMRQKSQRAVLHREQPDISSIPLDGQNVGAQGGATQMTSPYEQQIELRDVSTVLGVGLSKVVVKKEDEMTTFVDDLLARIDTPRRI